MKSMQKAIRIHYNVMCIVWKRSGFMVIKKHDYTQQEDSMSILTQVR